MNIQKSHLWIRVIFDIFFLFIISLFISFYVGKVAVDSFLTETRNIDNQSKQMAKLEESTLNTDLMVLQSYAELMKKMGIHESTQIVSFLDTIIEYQDFFNFTGFVSSSGTQFLNHSAPDDSIMQTSKLIRLLEKQPKTSIFTATVSDNTYLIFQSQVSTSLTGTTWLYAVSPQILPESHYTDLKQTDKTLITYILDSNNIVLARSATADKNFDYDALQKNRFISEHAEKDIAEFKKSQENHNVTSKKEYTIKRKIDAGFSMEQGDSSSDKLVKSIDNFIILADNYINDNNNFVWSENTIQLSSGSNLKLLIGIPLRFSEGTFSSFISTIGIVIISYIIFLIMTLTQLIQLGRSNHWLMKMAFIDQVTNWYNWNKFEIEMKKILRRPRGQQFLLLSLDIRRFKLITDISGQDMGNAILRDMAEQLKMLTGRHEIFARTVADEFVLLLRYTNGESLHQRIRQMETALCTNVPCKQKITLTFGVYIISDVTVPPIKMLNYTCMAKDTVCKNHDANIGYFDDSILKELLHERDIENDMETALEHHDFHVYLQPKYTPKDCIVAGAEALVRWIHPEKGFIAPISFIPVFERNSFIFKLDYYMMREVCKIQRKWLDAGNELIVVSVNISRAHLVSPTLVDELTAIIDEYNLPHSCIEVELTESAFFDNKTVLQDTVNGLRSKDIHVSMDDFGNGYSSLNSLKDITLDVVKLDAEFFKNEQNTEERGNTVIKHTIEMAKELNIKIVAEGIETKEQVDFLAENGCDLIQGYYFAKPMPVSDFEKLMNYTVQKE